MAMTETNRRPLDVRLLATCFKLLNALLAPVLALFRIICSRQDAIQLKLNERGFPDETACREWRKRARKGGSR
jgi:hypothetical protein